MRQEDFSVDKFEKRGDYDLYHILEEDVSKGFLHIPILEDRKKQENPRPWAKIVDSAKNVTGSSDGRVWVNVKGNFGTLVAIPLKHFENIFQEEVYPVISHLALLDTVNYYCPGEYLIKFPNDIICKEHGGKTCGTLIRREQGYSLFAPGVNLFGAPEGGLLRKDGKTACFIQKHCKGKLPTPVEFTDRLFENLKNISKKYDTPEKVVEIMNKEYNKYDKTYKFQSTILMLILKKMEPSGLKNSLMPYLKLIIKE